MELLQRLGPVTLLEHEMVRVFPRAVRDVQRTTLVDVVAGIFSIYFQRAQHAFQVAEINNVTATFNRLAKLRVLGEVLAIAGMDQQVSNCREVRRENDSIANEDDVSGNTCNLPVGTD